MQKKNIPVRFIPVRNRKCRTGFFVPGRAKKQGITCQHFRKLFRQKYSLPPAQYLRNQKMIRAAELLAMTHMRIKEIAFNCHYDSLMDFSRSFKKVFGISPTEYREQRISGNVVSAEMDPGKILQKEHWRDPQ